MLQWRHSRTFGAPAGPSASGSPPPRAHHFHFAHSALPSLFYQDPDQVLGWLAEPDPRAFLVDLWEDVGRRVVADGLGEELSSEGLSSERVTRETFRGSIVRMPAAVETGETLLLLLAAPPTGSPADGAGRPETPSGEPGAGIWDQLRSRGAPVARFFALELVQLKQEVKPTPRICEYSIFMGHVRTGYTCAPEGAAFLAEVSDRLDLY